MSYLYNGHLFLHSSMNHTGKSVNVLIDDLCLKGYRFNMEDISYFVQNEGSLVIPIYPYLVMEYAKENLNNLEISFMEYSKSQKNFLKYDTYLEFFDNYIIKSQNLSRFYFPAPMDGNITMPKYITELEEITDYLNILSGCDFTVAKQFNFPNSLRHKCNYYAVIYLMEGKATLEFDTELFHLRAGDFYIIPPEVYYAVSVDREGLCLFLNLRRSFVVSEYTNIFQGDTTLTTFISKTLDSEDYTPYLAIHTSNDNNIRKLFLVLFAEYINQDKYCNTVMKNYLSLLFATILRDQSVNIESSVKVSRSDINYQEILDYLSQNYQKADLASTANTIHFSKQYVCRIVKEKTGETFNSLLMNIRLDKAAQYLNETDLTLENIGYLCGFTAASHFSKLFKEHFGCTPSAYRKNAK